MTDGQYLKQVRNKLGLSQSEMSKKLGFSYYTYVSQLERDKAPMSQVVKNLLKYIEQEASE